MRFSVIVSKRDVAGLNIAKILIEKYGFERLSEKFDGNNIYAKNEVELIFGEEDILFLEHVRRETDFYVFASRHKSESRYPCLTVHPTGNFSMDTSYGGSGKQLCLTNSLLMKKALTTLNQLVIKRNLKYGVTLEVTHHGPTNLDKPTFFMEVGSAEDNWRDLNACECVADAIMHLKNTVRNRFESCIGFGGPHYAPTFTRNVLSTNNAVGHVCSKYAVNYLNREMISQMIEKTLPKPNSALIDWKGLRGVQRNFIIKILNELNLKVIKL